MLFCTSNSISEVFIVHIEMFVFDRQNNNIL